MWRTWLPLRLKRLWRVVMKIQVSMRMILKTTALNLCRPMVWIITFVASMAVAFHVPTMACQCQPILLPRSRRQQSQ